MAHSFDSTYFPEIINNSMAAGTTWFINQIYAWFNDFCHVAIINLICIMASHDRMKKTMNLQQVFKQNFPSFNFTFNYPLSSKSYFKIGGNAEVFYSAQTRQEAADLLSFCNENNIEFHILGGASNVIIADEGLRGLVLSLDFKELKVLSETKEELLIQAEAGIKTAYLVAQAANKGGSGLEGFIGVPGTLGGAIYNNAHYLNNLIGNHIKEVEVFDVKKGEIVVFSHEKCEFAYEKSIFQNDKNLLIFSAIFALKKDSPEEIKKRIKDSMERRESRQPLNLPSCGCVFQNPKNTEELKKLFPKFSEAEFIPSGFLIEEAGLKGMREGDIQISEKHAAFFVNLGKGTASDVKKLIAKVKAVVLEKFNVILKEEVFYLT